MQEQPPQPATPKFAYVFAAALGATIFFINMLIVALVWMTLEHSLDPLLPLIVTGITMLLSFGVAGYFFGKQWPLVGWHWGLWITCLCLLYGFISARGSYSSQFEAKKMLPFFLMAAVTTLPACVGSYLGSRARHIS